MCCLRRLVARFAGACSPSTPSANDISTNVLFTTSSSRRMVGPDQRPGARWAMWSQDLGDRVGTSGRGIVARRPISS